MAGGWLVVCYRHCEWRWYGGDQDGDGDGGRQVRQWCVNRGAGVRWEEGSTTHHHNPRPLPQLFYPLAPSIWSMGGDGGSSWDDGSYSGVRGITIVYDRCIDWIRVVYDKNGKPVTGQKHGGVGGNKTAEIKLQYPEEILISVSGHYCPVVHGGSPGRSGWYLDAIGFHLSQTRSTKLFEKVQKKLQKIASMAISAPKDSEATPRVKKNQSMRQ
ncbi:Jacalin-related lectin 19 [Vitis vinifera]|uniref:Jacalin-related lectin 19 n=1 Tax=Vitis vinifera TaxID=29760 RepID=A0A438EW26_VITVI|nr:Jacalin-related lectin 19 [Vitis vinifera]